VINGISDEVSDFLRRRAPKSPPSSWFFPRHFLVCSYFCGFHHHAHPLGIPRRLSGGKVPKRRSGHSNRAPTLPFMARSSLAVLLLLAALAGVVAARDIVHQDDEDPKFPAAPTILSWYGTLCSRHLPLFSCFLYAVLGPNFLFKVRGMGLSDLVKFLLLLPLLDFTLL